MGKVWFLSPHVCKQTCICCYKLTVRCAILKKKQTVFCWRLHGHSMSWKACSGVLPKGMFTSSRWLVKSAVKPSCQICAHFSGQAQPVTIWISRITPYTRTSLQHVFNLENSSSLCAWVSVKWAVLESWTALTSSLSLSPSAAVDCIKWSCDQFFQTSIFCLFVYLCSWMFVGCFVQMDCIWILFKYQSIE